MSKCKECKNYFDADYENGQGLVSCAIVDDADCERVIKCNHFEEKPKSNLKHFKEAKQTSKESSR